MSAGRYRQHGGALPSSGLIAFKIRRIDEIREEAELIFSRLSQRSNSPHQFIDCHWLFTFAILIVQE